MYSGNFYYVQLYNQYQNLDFRVTIKSQFLSDT